MGCAIRLVRGPLDANTLVGRLDRLLGTGIHLGIVEEHGRHILEVVISDEIANLELEIVLQMYRNMSTAWTNAFRSSGRAKSYCRQGLLVMVSWTRFILLSHFDVDSHVFTTIIVLLCLLLCFNVCIYAFHYVYMDDNS